MASRVAASAGTTGTAAAGIVREHIFEPDKSHQLLAYLAYHGGWVERSRLADLLWDTDERAAQLNLRQLIQRLRRFAWASSVEVERRRLRWVVDNDAARLRAALAAKDWGLAAALYTGPLMVGLEGYDQNEFAEWLQVEREQLHGEARDAALRWAEAQRQAGDPGGAVVTLERLLAADPFDEEVLVARLTAGAEDGHAGEALSSYRRFAARIKRELGLEPAAATQRLAEALAARPATANQPPPRPQASASTLPAPGTSFVGRDLELAEIAARFAHHGGRLVTLTGPSGIGKSRLAAEAARDLSSGYPDGASFVPLAAINSAADLPAAIAAALGVVLRGGDGPLEQLEQHLSTQRRLLVLDNFEQIVSAAPVVGRLLQASPGVDLLVTSHERLGLAEEWVLPLDGLAQPAEGASLAEAGSFDAVVLFTERARQLQPNYQLTADELPHVLAICRLVLGSPLGIELAAAWTRLLPSSEIAAEIGRTLDFLTTASRNVPARHSSLRAAFDHSWRLLSGVEQAALARLAPFRGGFKRSAASIVAGANLTVLTALVDKSLVRFSGNRFDVHPLLRTYLAERLATGEGEPERTNAQHARFVLGLVESEAGTAGGQRQLAWLSELDTELDNLRAALSWALACGDAELGLRLVAPLQRFWLSRGYFAEGSAWTAKVLAMGGAGKPSPALARALNTAGTLALTLADYQAAHDYLSRSREVARQVGSEGAEARVAIGLGLLAARRGELARAQEHYLEGLELQRRLGNREAVTGLLNNLGILALDGGRADQAAGWLTEGLELARADKDTYLTASFLNNLGWSESLCGRLGRAQELLEEALAVGRDAGDTQVAAGALNNLALVRLLAGDLEAALAASAESLALRERIGDRWGIAYSLDIRAAIAAAGGDQRRAARLWGAADGIRARIGSPLTGAWRQWQAARREQAQADLGEADYQQAAEQGAAMELEAAVRLAASVA